MRSTICPAFKNAMPTAWQNVISPCTKYSDNVGGYSSQSLHISATSDDIWLLAEYEVIGEHSVANAYEYQYQKQYDYYKNGNSTLKYKHNNTATGALWYLRSLYPRNAYGYCRISRDEGYSGFSLYANESFGFAPGFMVA